MRIISFKEMIRLSAKAVPAPGLEQEEKIDRIFSEQPYLANVYPGDTRKIGISCCFLANILYSNCILFLFKIKYYL